MNQRTRSGVLTVLAILAIANGPAAAQVWRCGDSYGERPCEGGRAVTVQDDRNQAQQSEAERAARRDSRLAEAMERDRLQHEAKLDRALRATAKAKPGSSRGLPADDEPQAWDFEVPPEPIVARVPKPPASAAGPAKPRTTPSRATMSR